MLQKLIGWATGTPDPTPEELAAAREKDRRREGEIITSAVAITKSQLTAEAMAAVKVLAHDAAAAAGAAMAKEMEETVRRLHEDSNRTQYAVQQLGNRYQAAWEKGVGAFVENEARRKMQLDAGDNQFWYDVVLAKLRDIETRVAALETRIAKGKETNHG